MRSSEIAAACGVSVRTLRHYHSIGLLPEPPRMRNGYRRYTVEHLAQLLRIRLLIAAGMPLSGIRSLLDGSDAALPELRRAERDLTARIDDVVDQRDLIRGLIASADGDGIVLLPPTLAPAVRGADDSVSPAWTAFDERLALMLHLTTTDKDRRRSIASAYRRARATAGHPQMRELRRRFTALTGSADAREIDGFVHDAISGVRALGDVPPLTLTRMQLRAVDLLIGTGPFNGAQRLALRRLLRTPAPGSTSA